MVKSEKLTGTTEYDGIYEVSHKPMSL